MQPTTFKQAARPGRGAARRGSALLMALLVLVLLASLAASSFSVHFAEKQEAQGLYADLRALHLAEAGIAESAGAIRASLDHETPMPLGVASSAAPVQVRGGSYWTAIADNGDGSYTVVSTGRSLAEARTLEAVLVHAQSDLYDHAVFAGNTGADPNYALQFGGQGAQADLITGNIYSGGDIEVLGDAVVAGSVQATGAIDGMSGSTGTELAPPDLAAMDYANTSDFDVAQMFADGQVWAAHGSSEAWQLPESSPAHIFRKNPDDRASETSATAKDDYFLEDPYETGTYTAANGGIGWDVSLSGIAGKPGPSGNDAVYYIDGNLWVHHKKPYGFRLTNKDAAGSRITLVVSGNIYLSDDVNLYDAAADGIVLIAMKDPSEKDSGNVYFGDALFGTLESMQAFIYAEDTFYDRNLDKSGSSKIKLQGNMTAGNQVSIQRDYVDGAGNPAHSRLHVEFDDRISTGALKMPGLPGSPGPEAQLDVASWRVVATP